MITISIIVTLLFIISLFIGNIIGSFLDINIIKYISFVILLFLGLYKLFEFTIKNFYIKLNDKEFKLFNIKFILNVISDSTLADIDKSKKLSIKESISLGVALSLDGICAALTVGMVFTNYVITILLSFCITLFMFLIGNIIGKKISYKKDINLSWLSGFILIILAITKLL